jgi:hypothetical protein
MDEEVFAFGSFRLILAQRMRFESGCAKRSAMVAPATATSPTMSGEVTPLSHR